jgi:hypothetical protein
MKAVLSLPEKPNPRSRGFECGLCAKAHHRRNARQLAPAIAFLHLAVDQARLHLPPAHVSPSTAQLEPLTKVSSDGIEVEIEPVTGKEREAKRRPGSVAESEEPCAPCVACVGRAQAPEESSCRDQWPARAPVRRCAAGCVVRPAGGEGAGDGRRSARAGCVRAHQHGTERLVIVACRKPKTRRASDESSPSASAESTMAIWCDGVFKRYKGVLRLEVNVLRQAGPRNV